jgi:hypothetical protein
MADRRIFAGVHCTAHMLIMDISRIKHDLHSGIAGKKSTILFQPGFIMNHRYMLLLFEVDRACFFSFYEEKDRCYNFIESHCRFFGSANPVPGITVVYWFAQMERKSCLILKFLAKAI